MRVCLHEGLLKDILGVFVVLRDVLCQTVDLALIPPHEFAERAGVTRTRTVYQRQLVSCVPRPPPHDTLKLLLSRSADNLQL